MRILRFDFSARALHWSHAVIFIWLLITGLQLFFTAKSLLGNPLIRIVHLYASIPFVLIPALIYIFGSVPNDAKMLISWTYDDLRWFLDFLKRKKTFVAGKFNGGQKANFFMSMLLISGLLFSGIVIWMKSMFTVGFVELNFMVHDTLAIISILLISGHIVYALYYRESLQGIVYGYVDEEWAEKHYPQWFLSGNKTK